MKNASNECPKCDGGGLTEFAHVAEGVCFLCKGTGTFYGTYKPRKPKTQAPHKIVVHVVDHTEARAGFERSLKNAEGETPQLLQHIFDYHISGTEADIMSLMGIYGMMPSGLFYRPFVVNEMRKRGVVSSLEYLETDHDRNEYMYH